MRGTSPLNDLISAEIASHGAISFARFMELALYQPQLGYYSSGRAAIGKEGDFFTNVSVGPVFGKLLAGQFEEMWQRLNRPAEFFIVEQGAHDGRLAADVLSALSGDFAQAAQYWIIDPSPVWREKQSETLLAFPRVRWVSSLAELPPFHGVHFSNELIDAFPFHLLRTTESGWQELFVSENNEGLYFLPQMPSPEICGDLNHLPSRDVGTIMELRPAARDWLQDLNQRLQSGFILIIDYGYGRAQLQAEHRTEGTFSCYRNHRRDADPLTDPGEKDITAHVDFTQLAEVAKEIGLTFEGFTDQHHFLVGAATSLLRSLEGVAPDAATQKMLRTLQTLLHPESMGTQFRYLAFSKSSASEPVLTGFQHARRTSRELFTKPEESPSPRG